MGGISKTCGAYGALLAAVVVFEGCSLFEQESVIDLARNPYIYRTSKFVAPRRSSSAVYVTRLQDRRTAPDVQTGGSYRQVYADSVWDRPPPVMVEELLIEEIDRSQIFNGVSSGSAGTPAATDFVLEPTLLEMYRMREVLAGDGMTGQRRTVAVSALRIRVHGPVDRIGRRPLLLDETFQEMVATPPSLARPQEGLVLAGRAMEKIVGRMLQKVYESHTPAVDATAAPASAPRDTAAPGKAGVKK